MAPCTIRFCDKKSQTSSFLKDGITFHRYPHDPDLKNKWIIATKRENWVPSTYSVICSRHFTDDCFIPVKNRRHLLSSAVPTKYLPVLSITDHSDIPMPSTSMPTGSILISPKLNLVMFPVITAGNLNVVQDSVLKLPPSSSTVKTEKDFPEIPSDYATTAKKRLCRRIIELSQKVREKNKTIKNLRENARYMRKRLVSLKRVIKELENKKLINTCNADILSKIGVTNKECSKDKCQRASPSTSSSRFPSGEIVVKLEPIHN